MNNIIICILIFFLPTTLTAKEFRNLVPKGLLELPGEKIYLEQSKNYGKYGLKQYCYKTNVFVVYSKNLLGEGYGFYKIKPITLKCIVPENHEVYTVNNLGISIESTKNKIEKLLDISLIEGANKHAWHVIEKINGVDFDNYTTLKIFILNNKIITIEVFNTITN